MHLSRINETKIVKVTHGEKRVPQRRTRKNPVIYVVNKKIGTILPNVADALFLLRLYLCTLYIYSGLYIEDTVQPHA